jgi:dTDP-4-amino-4,6-dideoxygalactose transaminase
MVGFNFRLSELSSAIAIEQLRRADHHLAKREHVGRRLSGGASDLAGLTVPHVRQGCRHGSLSSMASSARRHSVRSNFNRSPGQRRVQPVSQKLEAVQRQLTWLASQKR